MSHNWVALATGSAAVFAQAALVRSQGCAARSRLRVCGRGCRWTTTSTSLRYTTSTTARIRRIAHDSHRPFFVLADLLCISLCKPLGRLRDVFETPVVSPGGYT
jgi:hypothetical protein